MTENKHPESILIGGATVRNLIHGFSIGAPQGVRGFGYPPASWSPSARCTNCTAEWTFRCDLHRDARSGPNPGVSRRKVYILASG